MGCKAERGRLRVDRNPELAGALINGNNNDMNGGIAIAEILMEKGDGRPTLLGRSKQ